MIRAGTISDEAILTQGQVPVVPQDVIGRKIRLEGELWTIENLYRDEDGRIIGVDVINGDGFGKSLPLDVVYFQLINRDSGDVLQGALMDGGEVCIGIPEGATVVMIEAGEAQYRQLIADASNPVSDLFCSIENFVAGGVCDTDPTVLEEGGLITFDRFDGVSPTPEAAAEACLYGGCELIPDISRAAPFGAVGSRASYASHAGGVGSSAGSAPVYSGGSSGPVRAAAAADDPQEDLYGRVGEFAKSGIFYINAEGDGSPTPAGEFFRGPVGSSGVESDVQGIVFGDEGFGDIQTYPEIGGTGFGPEAGGGIQPLVTSGAENSGNLEAKSNPFALTGPSDSGSGVGIIGADSDDVVFGDPAYDPPAASHAFVGAPVVLAVSDRWVDVAVRAGNTANRGESDMDVEPATNSGDRHGGGGGDAYGEREDLPDETAQGLA